MSDELSMARLTKSNRRTSPRRQIEPLQVSQMSALSSMAKICKRGLIVEASTTGFLMHIQRNDIVSPQLRGGLDISSLEGEKVVLFLSQMELEVTGKIRRSKHIGSGKFELGIDYSEDAPEYWRECLMDLLPNPGELDHH